MKSHSWPQQEPAVQSVNEIDFQTASGNELFVLGRNIYQAADAFIDRRNNVTQLDKKKTFYCQGWDDEILEKIKKNCVGTLSFRSSHSFFKITAYSL